jgi:hypothetical protein
MDAAIEVSYPQSRVLLLRTLFADERKVIRCFPVEIQAIHMPTSDAACVRSAAEVIA